jgi:CMP-N,N'-diacetyllegionaminic acid synthase
VKCISDYKLSWWLEWENIMVSNIAIIPARGGSKGVPRKNIRTLAGKPLIAHSIEQALNAQNIDSVYVSTDDKEIAEISERYGANVIFRPDSISGDIASSEDAVIHAIEVVEHDLCVNDVFFLQCTSPIRAEFDLDNAYKQMKANKADSLLTVTESHSFLWRFNSDSSAEPINYDYKKRARRQDLEPQYKENGSFYINSASNIVSYKNRLSGVIDMYVMAEETAYEIDTETDFRVIEALMAK